MAKPLTKKKLQAQIDSNNQQVKENETYIKSINNNPLHNDWYNHGMNNNLSPEDKKTLDELIQRHHDLVEENYRLTYKENNILRGEIAKLNEIVNSKRRKIAAIKKVSKQEDEKRSNIRSWCNDHGLDYDDKIKEYGLRLHSATTDYAITIIYPNDRNTDKYYFCVIVNDVETTNEYEELKNEEVLDRLDVEFAYLIVGENQWNRHVKYSNLPNELKPISKAILFNFKEALTAFNCSDMLTWEDTEYVLGKNDYGNPYEIPHFLKIKEGEEEESGLCVII